MSNYAYGEKSRLALATCDARLVRVACRALAYGVMDIAVIEGHRSTEEQAKAFREGRSQIDGVKRKGKHNHKPSLAIDLLPWPAEINGVNVWSDKQRFSVLAGLMYAAAKEDEKEFPDEWDSAYLRWGGDWDGDGNNADSTLHDMPHFEIAFRN